MHWSFYFVVNLTININKFIFLFLVIALFCNEIQINIFQNSWNVCLSSVLVIMRCLNTVSFDRYKHFNKMRNLKICHLNSKKKTNTNYRNHNQWTRSFGTILLGTKKLIDQLTNAYLLSRVLTAAKVHTAHICLLNFLYKNILISGMPLSRQTSLFFGNRAMNTFGRLLIYFIYSSDVQVHALEESPNFSVKTLNITLSEQVLRHASINCPLIITPLW